MMQNVVLEGKAPATPPQQSTGGLGSNSAGLPAGCISKKWLFYKLRPAAAVYRAAVVREFMAAQNRLTRCGIDPDQYNRIRIFSAEATNVIIRDLQNLNFL